MQKFSFHLRNPSSIRRLRILTHFPEAMSLPRSALAPNPIFIPMRHPQGTILGTGLDSYQYNELRCDYTIFTCQAILKLIFAIRLRIAVQCVSKGGMRAYTEGKSTSITGEGRGSRGGKVRVCISRLHKHCAVNATQI
jgi:hypothetical protein